MSVMEKDILMQQKDENGNIIIKLPITTAENIIGLEDLKGSLIFPVTEDTSTSPINAKPGDLFLNTGTATYTIAGVSATIGDLVKITQLSPLIGEAAGNIRGAKGDKGDKGDTGAVGATGTPGAKGDKGDTGAVGAKGDKGEKGDKGDTGAQGIQGATGAQGPAGVAPSNVVTTDTTQTVSGAKTHTGVLRTSVASSSSQMVRNIAFGTSATPTGSTNDIYMQYS